MTTSIVMRRVLLSGPIESMRACATAAEAAGYPGDVGV